jgi:hypothetical protein
MTRLPTSDEQFGVFNPDDEDGCLQGPKAELDQVFDHHGYQVYDPDLFESEEDDG